MGTFAACWEAIVLKSLEILYCALFFVMLLVPAAETESNTVSHMIVQCNAQFDQGNYEGAKICYDKVIALGNQINAPIFSKVAIQSLYRMDATNKSNLTQSFSNIRAGPTNAIKGQLNPAYKNLSISFDVSNPNNMHMRISNIYVEVIKYSPIINSEIIQNLGKGYTRGYSCSIEPAVGSYKCDLTSKDYDFIDLAPTELENIAIDVNADKPGAYELRINLDYAFGDDKNRIIVGDVPGMIGFFDEL